MNILYVGFKGQNNSSNKVVRNMFGEKLYLTNSYSGLKSDIENLERDYDIIYMFGLDKRLNSQIRIESTAIKDNVTLYSNLSLEYIAQQLSKNGISSVISGGPSNHLCNEAYWYMLQKYHGKAVFFHIPSLKYITQEFILNIHNTL